MKVKDLVWNVDTMCDGEVTLYSAKVDCGMITVLDRQTGWHDFRRDTESGYKDFAGQFWLASGMFDIRNYPEDTVEEAVDRIKLNANTCVGV